MPKVDAHFKVSMLKSGIRIAGYILLFLVMFDIHLVWIGIGALVASEVIGIIEEFVTEDDEP